MPRRDRSGLQQQKDAELWRQRQARSQVRARALTLLWDATVDGRMTESATLREELGKLREWWYTTCDAVNNRRTDTVLADEAEYAVEWCIALATEIIEEEFARRAGDLDDRIWQREHLWNRFRSLEAGLMSNGLPRLEKRP